jgi:nitrogen regulatory protein PII
MDQTHYQSKSQMKRAEKQLEADAFIKEKKITEIKKRWEDSQLKAATMQSVLGYMVEQYTEHRDELSEEVVNQTEEQIALRRTEIEDFLMSEQKVCLEALEEYSDTVPTINYSTEEKNG